MENTKYRERVRELSEALTGAASQIRSYRDELIRQDGQISGLREKLLECREELMTLKSRCHKKHPRKFVVKPKERKTRKLRKLRKQ
jgi:hypothetical protein